MPDPANDGCVDAADGRLWAERVLLPPSMTFVRAAASGIFFLMLYGFVFATWYVAIGGDVCRTERRVADRAQAEVLRLRAEVQTLQELRAIRPRPLDGAAMPIPLGGQTRPSHGQ